MKGKKVIIVDDEPGIRDLLTCLLEPKGYSVFTANDGVEGVEKIRNGNFDIAFLDVHMPKMNGLEALRQIRVFNHTIRIVLSTSGSDPGHLLEHEAGVYGIDVCLYKPFDIDEIIRAVEKIEKEGAE
jgi:CheY-like chemotaxis protein